MCQTYDAAGPDDPNTAGIPYTDEMLQVPHKVTGECTQGVNQMEERFLSMTRVFSLCER